MIIERRLPRAPIAAVLLALVVGGALRFTDLGAVPPALYCDEAFQGYEAYSLLSTGADSRGVTWPLFFDTFGIGWEEPLYVYLTMIPVALLGTTEAATRVVAAAAGTLNLAALAWLAWRLAGPWAGAAAAMAAAVSPWAFHFSRVGFQASLLPLFLAAGAAALLEAARPSPLAGPRPGDARGDHPSLRPPWLAAGAMLLILALYTYVAARGVVPLVFAGFAALHARGLRRLGIRRLALLSIPCLLATRPLALFALSPEGMERFDGVGLPSRLEGREAAQRFVSNYLSYFSFSFLLTDGDPNMRHSVAGFGVLHAHDLALVLAGGIAALVRRRPSDLLLVWWAITAPLGAALTVDAAHAVRSLGTSPAVYALAGSGAVALFGRASLMTPRRLRGALLLGLFLTGAAASSAAYLHRYFVAYPIESAPAWQYGLKEAFAEIESRAAEHDSIYVTRAEDYPWIHRLYLFAFPPALYQASRLSGTKYLFDEPVFYRGGLVPGRLRPLFLLRPEELSASGMEARKTIALPDGSPAFVLAW